MNSAAVDNISHINPEGMMKSPAFSQIVTTHGNGRTIYIGGQNAVTADPKAKVKSDIVSQTEQVMRNLTIALEACGATFDNVVKMNVYLVQGQDARVAFETSQKFMKNVSQPPAVTGLFVAALANPEFLVEVDLVAFVPE